MTLNSAFKYIVAFHTRIFINRDKINKTKENVKLLKKNNILILLGTISADDYEYSSKTRQIYSVGYKVQPESLSY